MNFDLTLDRNLLILIVLGALTAIACWFLLYGIILLFMGREAKIRSRITQFVTQQGQADPGDATQRRQMRSELFSQIDSRWSEQTALRSGFNKLAADLAKADLHITVTELLIIQVSVSAGLAILAWVLAPAAGPLVAALAFILGLLIVRAYLGRMGRQRVRKFEDQLPDTLSIVASSVRGGFSLFQALQLVAREAAEPTRSEFLRVIQEVSLGAPMDDALNGLASRMPTEDVEILVTAISLQHETGGSLSHVLDVVANTVRERHRVEREIKSLTAQQRFSAILLAALPYLLGLVLFVISPVYMSHLFQWGWVLVMPVGAIILSFIGLLLMRRIAAIDV